MDGLKHLQNSVERIVYKASFCRQFEKTVQSAVKNKYITCPVYLSIGQEILPAMLSEYYPSAKIFAQHRAHSYYLSFGGGPIELIQKLYNGNEGSASISIKDKMFGHSGLMGDQVPIAVGAALGGMCPVITVMGDASAEEDYVLGAMGFASKRKLPILFVIEDNNLSILTEKKVRRDWSMKDIGKSFKLPHSIECDDSIEEIACSLKEIHSYPSLLNVASNRLCWHAGVGMNEGVFDRLENEISSRDMRLIQEMAIIDNGMVWEKWAKQYQIQ